MSESTTIAALTTAPAPAGIAIVRVSGPDAKQALKAIFKAKISPTEKPRMLIFGDLVDWKSGETIDHALAVYMPNPHSYTGEDVGEFQFHGSPLLVQKVLRSLYAFGISPAEPGEFTRRAFLNGKMDLAQAESIADLIGASNEQALKIAGEQLSGRFSRAIEEVGDPLRDSLAEVEANIDFPEEDIEPQKKEEIINRIKVAQKKIDDLLQTYSFGHIAKEGFRVLLCGPPNAGKSSLLNLVLGKDRAIVTDISGTTRDLIEEDVMLDNFKFVFCDSAGIRETSNTVEKIGIELAKDKIPWADLVILLADASDEKQAWKEVLPSLRGQAKRLWMVINKIDLNPKAIGSIFCDSNICQQNFYISAKTRAGVEPFFQALVDEVKASLPISSDSSLVVTNERHRHCLSEAQSALNRAINGVTTNQALELISADLREALKHLDEIVGKTYTEDILGRIFSKFCIGK